MEIFKGNVAFSGIAIGKIVYYSRGEYQMRQYMISNVQKELRDFRKAVLQVREYLQQLYEEAKEKQLPRAARYQSQLKILEEKEFVAAIESIVEGQNVGAGYAVKTTRDEIGSTFSTLADGFIQERIQNVQEVCGLILRSMGQTTSKINLGDEPIILIAENLAPTEILEMDKTKLLAVVTRQGSEISHAAIMAKTIDIPAMFGVAIDEEWDGHMAIVDGYTGTFYLDPGSEMLKEYSMRKDNENIAREELRKLRDQEDITEDGHVIPIYANIGNLDDLNSVSYYGAAGIGLLRSEFQYLGRETYPREQELFAEYKKLAEAMGDKVCVIRTVDLGGDKRSEYMDIPREENPIMGNRGIRLCLDRTRMFRAQLRAIYRASAYGNLEIMYPMITNLEEVDEIDRLTEEILKDLTDKGIPHRRIRRGIMVETPAAVMTAEELAERVDFLSLGTNDLTQYTLAMDRQNPYLKEKYNDHHPAIMRMIEWTIEGGHRKNKPVYICGELAADTRLIPQFLSMGIDGFSVVPACILPVRKELRASRVGEKTE